MPEFEENNDASKNAPYTYEPSQASAAELGELAGVVITPGSSTKTPTKSRWGKSAAQQAAEAAASDVPAGEVDLSNVSALTDDLMKGRGAASRAPRERKNREERSEDKPRREPSEDKPRREGSERSPQRERSDDSSRERSRRRSNSDEGGERRERRRRSPDSGGGERPRRERSSEDGRGRRRREEESRKPESSRKVEEAKRKRGTQGVAWSHAPEFFPDRLRRRACSSGVHMEA